MTTLMIWIGGALVGIAVARLAILFLQPQPKLSAVLERMGETTGPNSEGLDGTSRVQLRMASFARRNLSWAPRLWDEKDKKLVRINETNVLAQKVTFALLGLLGILALGLVFSRALPFTVPAIAAPIIAVLMWFLPDLEIRDNAKAARREFARAMPLYLDLLAVERESGRPPGMALSTAARVPQATPFEMITEVLTMSTVTGEQPWDALSRLSEEIGVPELGQAADHVASAGTEGAAVAQSLRKSAKAMRQAQLSEDHKSANGKSSSHSTLLMAIVMIYVFIILTPVLLGMM